MAEVLAQLTTALADRYRLEGELGRGGMATVYLAEYLKYHPKVAVKVLRPGLAALLGAKRFLEEIHVTAHLQHPHILPLFDSGAADSFPPESKRAGRCPRVTSPPRSPSPPHCPTTPRARWCTCCSIPRQPGLRSPASTTTATG
jgi:serine/threonine protein kinase